MEEPAGLTPRRAFLKGLEAGWLLGGGIMVLLFAAILQAFGSLPSPLPWWLGGAAVVGGFVRMGTLGKLPK